MVSLKKTLRKESHRQRLAVLLGFFIKSTVVVSTVVLSGCSFNPLDFVPSPSSQKPKLNVDTAVQAADTATKQGVGLNVTARTTTNRNLSNNLSSTRSDKTSQSSHQRNNQNSTQSSSTSTDNTNSISGDITNRQKLSQQVAANSLNSVQYTNESASTTNNTTSTNTLNSTLNNTLNGTLNSTSTTSSTTNNGSNNVVPIYINKAPALLSFDTLFKAFVYAIVYGAMSYVLQAFHRRKIHKELVNIAKSKR